MSEPEGGVTVDLAVPQRALRAVLDDLAERTGDSIELTQELFWSLPPSHTGVAEPYEPPVELTIGSLSETYEYVRAVAEGEKPPIDYVLVWLADLLRAVAVEPE
jgi:hypothetical protein